LPENNGMTLRGGIAALPLAPGVYLLDLVLRDEKNQVLDHRLACAQVEIVSDEKNTLLFLPEAGGVRVPCTWERL